MITNKIVRKNQFLFLFIIALASILRLWKLGTIPPHLTPDEASLGYNAYSILKTGKDEYGEVLPIIFKSFGDYKPGLYVYATVPFVAILGLNEWSVRLPSALAGIVAVWLIYKIVHEFFAKQDGQLPLSTQQSLASISAALLAVSPWHIHFSRGAWEVNLSLTLTLAGIYFFLKSLSNIKFLFFSSIFFSATLLTYQGAKLSTLIVLFVLVVAFWRGVKEWFTNSRPRLVGSIILGLAIASPVFFSLFSGKTGRLEVFSVFSYPRKSEELIGFLEQGNESTSIGNYILFHTETLNFARGIMERWFNHFSGRFLFFEGDWQNPRHSAPNSGMMLLSDLVLIVIGAVSLLKSKNLRLKTFILLWLILSPLPSALSRDQVHAVRSFNMVIPLVLISALGVWDLINKSINFGKVKGSNINSLIGRIRSAEFTFSILLCLILLSSIIYFLDAYFVHLPKHNSRYWEYGYKQIVEVITPIQNNYREIKIQQSFAQPYIYFLFYQKYNPAKYQRQARLTESEFKDDVGYVERLDNICFCAIDWPANKSEHGTLVVADSIKIPEEELGIPEVNLIKEIRYLDGSVAFRVVEVK